MPGIIIKKSVSADQVGISHLPKYTVLEGGFPIKVEGEIVGGVGVSVGSIEEDISIAQAALTGRES